LIGSLSSVLHAGRAECKVTTEEGSKDGPSKDGHWISSDELTHKCHARILQNAHNVLPHQIQILFTHFGNLKEQVRE